ncbi:polyadenylate-binding protein 1-B-binding protein [Trifolium repens]|nr:polyadenylate-binding protein 1-B-binding protein [Trifolium repens]
MDNEQEDMQFLGFFGCYKESFKIIFSWRKIFTQITLTLLLPLSFIFLFHIEVSNLIFKKIQHTEEQIDHTQQGTPKYEKLTDIISSQFITLLLFKLLYFTFLLIFSLLSTSAIVYTTASIFTSKDVSYKKVMKIVPKVVVVDGTWCFGYVDRTAYGILSLLLLSLLFLFGLVLQTVLYLVCKSYHHENIDKSALADHLEVYLGEYVPLTAKDVQLENYRI